MPAGKTARRYSLFFLTKLYFASIMVGESHQCTDSTGERGRTQNFAERIITHGNGTQPPSYSYA